MFADRTAGNATNPSVQAFSRLLYGMIYPCPPYDFYRMGNGKMTTNQKLKMWSQRQAAVLTTRVYALKMRQHIGKTMRKVFRQATSSGERSISRRPRKPRVVPHNDSTVRHLIPELHIPCMPPRFKVR